MPLLLILVAIFFIGGGSYAYLQTKPDIQPAVVDSNVQVASMTRVVPEPIASEGKMLLGNSAFYENLSPEEKDMVESYYSSLGITTGSKDVSLKDSRCLLKYYDSMRMLVACPVSQNMTLVNRNNMTVALGSFSSFYAGYAESMGYVISVNDGGISYYKAGNSAIQNIPNSKPINGESYVDNEIGMPDSSSYHISFNESTKTLSVSVYKSADGPSSPKIRTAKFVLP